MSDLIEPITASADGRRNSYCVNCKTTGQAMSYAACLWRQNVLSAPDIKTPADWAPCAQAARHNECPANTMRKEEVLAGKAIYFVERSSFRTAVETMKATVREWVMPKSVTAPRSAPRSLPKTTMLDAMGDAGGYAEAITAAATAPRVETRPIPVAQAGESPLQMARRLAAERNTAIQQ